MTLLASFSVSGGSPPPTLESLRVDEDGRARAIVTGAWPDGSPQDEAGVYEQVLDAGRLRRLRELRVGAGEHGEVRADSGRSSLRLGEVKVTWSTFATPPASVAAAAAALREVLATVREHPLAAVRLDGTALRHAGAAPVTVSGLRLRVAPFDGDGVPPLSVYHAAAEVATLERATLADGEALELAAPLEPGTIAFVTATITLPDSAPLQGFLISRR